MDAAVGGERLYVRDQSTTEIVSQPRRLSLIQHFTVPLWRPHIARLSAKALPYALKKLDLLGDRQSLVHGP